MFGLAGLSIRVVASGPYHYRLEGPLDWFMQWDARWFLEVAHEGYSYDPAHMSSVNFLPLYPMLVRALGWIVPNLDLAAYIVSNGCALAAAALLWRLTREIDERDAVADGAVLFFFFGPVGLFFASVYSESTFLVCALASMLAARRERWVAAGLWGAAAALSRSVGLLLILPLLVEFVQRHASKTTWRQPRTWLTLLCLGLPALATLSYFAYLGWRFGDPLAYVVSQQHGGHRSGRPWQLFATDEFHALPPFYKYWFGAAAVTGFVLLIAGMLVRLPWSFTALAAAFCWLYYSTRSLEGMPRFLSVVFPFYITLGRIHVRWPALGTALLAVCASLLAFSVILFVNGYWFT